ncbi:MAG: hypothetical protein PVI00_03535 [Desulfobacterales bacterium]|jgi:hypothetical protein
MIKVFIDDQIMQSILSGLFDQVKSKIDLNLNYLKKRCQEKYGIEKIEGVEHKDGNIVVYKDQIACQLNYEVRFPVSVLITTREKINSSVSPNDVRPSEIDGLSKDLGDVAKESDDFLEEVDDVALDLDDFLEDIDEIAPELDLEDLEPEHDEIDEILPKTQASDRH